MISWPIPMRIELDIDMAGQPGQCNNGRFHGVVLACAPTKARPEKVTRDKSTPFSVYMPKSDVQSCLKRMTDGGISFNRASALLHAFLTYLLLKDCKLALKCRVCQDTKMTFFMYYIREFFPELARMEFHQIQKGDPSSSAHRVANKAFHQVRLATITVTYSEFDAIYSRRKKLIVAKKEPIQSVKKEGDTLGVSPP